MNARSLFLSILLASLVADKSHARVVGCENIQFKANTIDRFQYHGIVENGINGTTNNVTKLKFTAYVDISNSNNCDFILKLSKVKFFESIGSNDKYTQFPRNDLIDRLEKHPLKFEMKKGVVKKITPSVKSIQSDVLNLQRGILSTLQVRSVTEKDPEKLIVEDDISGSCETVYLKMKKDSNYDMIEKVKDLNTCVEHHHIRSTVDGNSYSEGETDKVKDSVYDSQNKCVYKFALDGSGLERAFCKERFLARAFSYGQAGAYVLASTKLKRVSSSALSNMASPYRDFYSTSIKYDHVLPVDKTSNSIEYRRKAKALLLELADEEYYVSKYDSAQRFFALVVSFRHLKLNDIQAIVGSIDLRNERIRTFLFDAMGQCGTASCLQILFKTMEDAGMQQEAMGVLPFLAFIKDPTPEVIGLLLGLHQKTQHPSLILLITTLSYRMCNNDLQACATGRVYQTMKDTENYLLSMLGKDCQTSDAQKQHKIFYALKGIGNLGRPTTALPLIMDCVMNAKHANMSTAALKSIRKMNLSAKTRYTLLEILADQNNELEKRVEVFTLLMQNPTREEIIFARDVANDPQDVTQLRSFVNSYLRSAMKNKAPASIGKSKLVKEVLKENPLMDFDPSPSRYSKAFLHSANFMQFAATVDGMTFFHPESFVPRAVNFNLTTHLFGFSINAFEVNARMEGLEQLVSKYLSKEGYMSTSYLKKVFKIPTRFRRGLSEENEYENIDKQVNMKASTPQALISLKMFGNEIQVLSLDDLPFLNGKMDDINIIHDLYELTRGKRKVLKHNMVVMEVSHTVPTLLGMPMKIDLNGSAVVTIDMNGKVDTKNLIFGPKTVTINGNLKPSVSLHASGKLSVQCYGFNEIGTSFLGNVHFGKDYHGKIHYEEGKEALTELKADDKITDLFNVSYNIFHESSLRKEEIKGVEKRAKGYLCTKDLFDTSYIGSDICMQANFPNAFYNITAPFFPLTGPFDFGVRSYPEDPLLKKYMLHIKKIDDIYSISIGTPGATSERKYSLNLGLTRKEEGGLVGFTIGELKRGIVLDYVFDEDTNELQATLTSNFTKSPIILYGEYINRTDPMTLNKHVGTKWSFTYEQIFIQHDLFYKTTYEHWSLGSKLEYAKKKFVTFDLKIQYQPQQVTLLIEHPPTNTNVYAKAVPSLPKLESQLNITHGAMLDFNSYAMLDISKYEVFGDMKLNLHKKINHHLNAKGKIEPRNKRIWLKTSVNGVPYSLDSKFTGAGQTKTLSTDFVFGKIKPVHKLMWDHQSINTTLDVGNEFNMYWKNSVLRESKDTLNMVSLMSGARGEEFQLKNVFKNSSDLHEVCTTITTTTKDKSNTYDGCYTFHHSIGKQGIVMKSMKNVLGEFTQKIILLRQKLPSGDDQVNLQILNYLNLLYANKNGDFSMNFDVPSFSANLNQWNENNLRANVSLRGKLNATAKLDYTRNVNGKMTDYSITAETSQNNAILGKVELTSSIAGKFPMIFGGPYVNTLVVYGNKQKQLFKGVIKDHLSPSPTFVNEDYTLINMKGWKMIGYKVNIKNSYQYGIVEEKTSDQTSYAAKFAKFNPWQGTLGPLETMLSFVLKTNGKMQIIIHETQATKQYSAIGQGLMMQYIGKYANQVFGIIGLDKELNGKLTKAMQTAMISYFSTTKCNGKNVHEKFIKNEFGKEDVVKIMSAILKFPISKQFQEITKLDLESEKDIAGKLVSALKNNENKNILEMVGGIIGDLSGIKNTEGKEYLLKLKRIFQNDKSFNIFEKEFFSLIQQLVEEIQKLVKNEKKIDIEKLDMSFLNKFLPVSSRKAVVTTLKESLKVFASWKYDILKTPQENIKLLMKDLEKVKAFKLLGLNHVDIIATSIIRQSRLPKDLENVLIGFLRNLDHVTLVRKVSKFALQSFDVPTPHKNHVDKLMNSKTIDEYFNTLANVIHKKGKLSEKQKKSFKTFLDTQNRLILFKQIKEVLKEKHGVSDSGIELLETIIADGDLRSFKNLPTIYSVNFFPKMLKKVLENLKNLNLSGLLKQLTVFIKDKDVKDALKGVIDNKENLNDLPVSLMKMLIKKSDGLDLGEKEKKALQEINELSMKFLAIALGKETNQGEIIKKLVIEYYGSIYGMLDKVLPGPLKPIAKKLSTKIFEVLKEMKATDLEVDATDALFKASKKVSIAVVTFVDENFEKFIKDDLMHSMKAVLQRIKSGPRYTLWDLKEMYMKKTSEQLSFLIRLLGQFSSTEKNYFAEQFIKDGKILYYKIYQSIWKTQVSNPKNLKQLAALFTGLEKKALEMMKDVTGDYSIKTTIDKIVMFVKDMVEGESLEDVIVKSFKGQSVSVFSNISTAIVDQINQEQSVAAVINKVFYITKGFVSGHDWLSILLSLNQEDMDTISYSSLLAQMEEFLVVLGHLKSDGQTINNYISKLLPDLSKGVTIAYQEAVKSNKQTIKAIKKIKIKIAKAFDEIEKKMDETINKEHGMVKMLLEVFAPSINGIRPLILRAISRDKVEEERRLAEIRKVCKNEQLDLVCEFLFFYDNIKVVKKDETILDALLNGVEQMVLRMMDEQINKTKTDEQRLKRIFIGITTLSTKKLDNPLKEFVFSMADFVQIFMKNEDYEKYSRMMFPGEKQMTLKVFVNKFIATPLNDIKWKLSDEKIQASARKYIPKTISVVSKTLQDISRKILFGIDDVKTPLANSPFVSDPVGFVVNLPKTILADINKNMDKYKETTLKSFKRFEIEVKRVHKKVLRDLIKYSGKLDDVSEKLLKTYREELSKHLDPAIKTLEDVNKKVEKELEGYMITSNGNEHFKKRLSLLTKKSKGLRQKYGKIQQQYMNAMMKEINNLLNKKDLMAPFSNKEIMKKIFGNIDRKLMAKVLTALDQDVNGVISNTMYPQLEILAQSLDETVCKIKKNISKYYTKNDQGQFISWDIPGFYQQYERVEKKIDEMIMKVTEVYKNAATNVKMIKYREIKGMHAYVFDQLTQRGMNIAKNALTQYAMVFDRSRKIYAYFGGKTTDQILEILARKYKHQIKEFVAFSKSTLTNFVPPSDIETPVFKFLGFRNEEEKRNLFEPVSRSAYLFEKSLVTFDGKAIYLPKGIMNKYKTCKYLLTRDFQWKNFTVYINNGKFIVEMIDGKVVIDRDNDNKVTVHKHIPPMFQQVQTITEFPVQLAFSSVLKPRSNLLKIESLLGLTVYCTLDSFMCNVTVSGYYHNKTLGLFGTNNVENSDDLRMPNGEVALDLVEFVNAYELRQKAECFVDDPSEIVDQYKAERKKKECDVFEKYNTPKEVIDYETRSLAFKDVCRNEQNVGNILKAHTQSVMKEFGHQLSRPSLIAKNRMLRYSSSNKYGILQLTILLKLVPNIEKTRPHLKRILKKVQDEIGAKNIVRYCIVGYGGKDIRMYPHVQTGNGEVFTNLEGAIKALDLLSFAGKNVNERLGLRALKFASQLDFKMGTKVFLLFDDDSSYTHALREMIDVNGQLTSRGVILNTVNTYKMRRDVIGKDSCGKRYHVREPLGQNFRQLQFPNSDDYIPLVKQSNGAVFTLKAFVSQKSKWTKALPLSVNEVLSSQLKMDQKQLKDCSGDGRCKNVANNGCDL